MLARWPPNRLCGSFSTARWWTCGSTARRPQSRCWSSSVCARMARKYCWRSRAWVGRAAKPGAVFSMISSVVACAALSSLPAIHDQELRAAQATTDEIIENTAPGFAALPTHALDRQQYFLAIRAHADDDQQRDCGRLAVEPHVHHRAVENEPHNRFGGQRASIPGVPIGFHLAPDPAHRILAHGAAEQRLQGAAHPARVGAGQVGAGNQRIGRQRAALVGPQHLAVPLRGFAAWSVQPRAWYFDLDATEGAHQRP